MNRDVTFWFSFLLGVFVYVQPKRETKYAFLCSLNFLNIKLFKFFKRIIIKILLILLNILPMKNEKNINYYDSSRFQAQEDADGASFISLLLCSFGMFTRNKLFIWLAVFFIISTLCRKKYSSSLSQYLINGAMLLFALVSSYVFVPQGAWNIKT